MKVTRSFFTQWKYVFGNHMSHKDSMCSVVVFLNDAHSFVYLMQHFSKEAVTEARLTVCCIISSLKKNHCMLLGAERPTAVLEARCFPILAGISVVQQDLLCRTFHFIMLHLFSMGDGSGLQEGQFSTQIILLQNHAVGKPVEYSFPSSC